MALQYTGGVYRIKEWAHIVTCHSLPGEAAVRTLGKSAQEGKEMRGCLLLAEMSSKGNLLNEEYTKKTLEMGMENSDFVMGFICTASLADKLALLLNQKEQQQYDFLWVTPGVSDTSEGSTDDTNEDSTEKVIVREDGKGQQYRTVEQVILSSKSDIIVVGRAIYANEEKWEVNAKRFQEAGWKAYLKRINQK